MHLKILIGVLFVGLAAANPKADPKPAAKTSPQFLQSYPGVQPNYYPGVTSQSYPGGQPNYYPGVTSYFGQEYAAQPIAGQPIVGHPAAGQHIAGQHISAQSIAGQPFAGHYDLRYSPASYGAAFGNAFGAQQVYPQAAAGNYYQSSQPIPVPVAYSSGSPAYGAQSASYYGAARLWPKALISPAGSPSPVPESLARAYYAVSTPSPFAAQTVASVPVTTPSPVLPQKPIPVPVKVDSRSSFVQNLPVPVSSPAPYVASYQQYSTPAPFAQRYVQPTGYSFSTTNTPYVEKYQQPSTRYQVNYHSTPAPFQVKYQHSTPAPSVQYQSTPAPQVQYQSTPAPQVQYQSTPAPAVQVKYDSTPAPVPQVSYKYQQPAYYPVKSTPVPYPVNYQLPAVSSRSPFAAYQYQQPTVTPYEARYQQQSVSPFGVQYQPTASPYWANQRFSVPVGYPQSQYNVQAVQPSVSYPVTSKQITVVPTAPTPVKTVSITENTFVPVPTTPSPKATIIKSEYSAGTVSPQYNHISQYSTPSPFASVANAYLPQSVGKFSHSSYAPSTPYSIYSPSTAVFHVRFNGLGHSYSY